MLQYYFRTHYNGTFLFKWPECIKCYVCSVVVPRLLFDLGFEKKYSGKICVSTLVPRPLQITYFATFMDHWVLRMLFVHLIN